MQTIEFDSHVENGIIAVPSQYQNIIPRSVRVIVLPKEESPSNPQNIEKEKSLYSLAVDMTGFTFDRDEINER